ncbi:MAG: hypothetical protein K2X12_02605 [Burkholderiaceae bacterium]|jgi:hypothetical protein|nr:hypothetical protein [Burkholderiaceae bacterium]
MIDTATSCGLVAKPTDSIERLGFIAIRYRAWIGEALAFPFITHGQPSRQRLQTLHGTFDVIEHLAQDFLEGPEDDPARTRGIASYLMDSAAGMKRMLGMYGAELADLLVPTVSDLQQLYSVCEALGGRPKMFDTF